MSCVYFIQVQPNGPIKIGTTMGNVAVRMKALQHASPHELKWIGYFPGTQKDELAAHHRLAGSRCRAEWFYPTREVLDFVREKSHGVSVAQFMDEIFMEPQRAIVQAAIPREKKSTVRALGLILSEAGTDNWHLSKWLAGRRAIDPNVALKAARCAAKIISGEIAA